MGGSFTWGSTDQVLRPRTRLRTNGRFYVFVLLLLTSAHAFLPRMPKLSATRYLQASSPVSSKPSSSTTPVATDAAQYWPLLEELVSSCLVDDKAFSPTGTDASPSVRPRQRDVGASGEGMVAIGASLADTRLVDGLELMKVRRNKDGSVRSGFLRFWNSVPLEFFGVSRNDLRVYARMRERVEKALGFTASPAVERVEGGIAIVMALSIASALTTLDKLPGPDIVRWFATSFLVSIPFAYISLGLSFPEVLMRAANQVLFALNREYKERLLRHEAGHFLVGYLCGLPVLSYSVSGRLNAVEFAQILSFAQEAAAAATVPQDSSATGPAMLPSLPGPVSREEAERWTPRGVLLKEELARLTVVSLAGVVSEYIAYGKAEGGGNDLSQLLALFNLADPAMSDREQERWLNCKEGWEGGRDRGRVGGRKGEIKGGKVAKLCKCSS